MCRLHLNQVLQACAPAAHRIRLGFVMHRRALASDCGTGKLPQWLLTTGLLHFTPCHHPLLTVQAQHAQTQAQVAVKVLPLSQLSANQMAQILRGLRVHAQCVGMPHVLPLYAVLQVRAMAAHCFFLHHVRKWVLKQSQRGVAATSLLFSQGIWLCGLSCIQMTELPNRQWHWRSLS